MPPLRTKKSKCIRLFVVGAKMTLALLKECKGVGKVEMLVWAAVSSNKREVTINCFENNETKRCVLLSH